MERTSATNKDTQRQIEESYLRLAQQIALVALASEINGLSRKHTRKVLTELETRGMLTPELRKIILDTFGNLQRDMLSLLG